MIVSEGYGDHNERYQKEVDDLYEDDADGDGNVYPIPPDKKDPDDEYEYCFEEGRIKRWLDQHKRIRGGSEEVEDVTPSDPKPNPYTEETRRREERAKTRKALGRSEKKKRRGL